MPVGRLGMSKLHLGSKLAAGTKSLFTGCELLARKCGLIKRFSRKFSAAGFALALLKAVTDGKASFNQLATKLGQSEGDTLTPQALWKRVDRGAVGFMMALAADAIAQRWGDDQHIASRVFNRVLVQDSSQSKLPNDNHEEFPGHGNDKGKTAGCKFDFSFNLLNAEIIADTLHLATAQDKELGKDLVDLAEKGDLFLRDMGYFSLAEFARIARRGAYWLSRLPVNVKAWDRRGRTLETILKSARGNRVEIAATLGEAGHRARLVAVRAAPSVADKRRRERRKQARKNGKQPNKNMLVRDGWYILVTNVGKDLMKAEDLFGLYRVRWQIEIIFRAWKQSIHLEEALKRRSNPFHLQSLMYAGILLLILTMKTAALLQGVHRERPLSIERIADAVTMFLPSMTSLHDFANQKHDPRHLQMDRRTRKSLREIACAALS